MDILLPIPGLHKYAITRDGRVWSLIRNKFMKSHRVNPKTNHTCYDLRTNDGKSYIYTLTHRLVFASFVLGYMPPSSALVLHKDGNAENNDYTNLYLGNHYENSRDMYRHGNRASKISDDDVLKIMVDPRGHASLSKEYSCSDTYILYLRQGKTRAHLTHYPQCPVPYLNTDVLSIKVGQKRANGSQIILDSP